MCVQNGNKVVCGCGDGVLNIWSWGEWGDVSDRLPGHPSSVDACISVTDNLVCTGCLDGTVRLDSQSAGLMCCTYINCCILGDRLVEIQPNRMCRVLGEHQEPVEQLRLSHDGGMVASCSHDATVKFWDITDLESSDREKTKAKKRSRKQNHEMKGKRVKQSANPDFFSDL